MSRLVNNIHTQVVGDDNISFLVNLDYILDSHVSSITSNFAQQNE